MPRTACWRPSRWRPWHPCHAFCAALPPTTIYREPGAYDMPFVGWRGVNRLMPHRGVSRLMPHLYSDPVYRRDARQRFVIFRVLQSKVFFISWLSFISVFGWPSCREATSCCLLGFDINPALRLVTEDRSLNQVALPRHFRLLRIFWGVKFGYT